jgi:hypothetical protein
MFLFEFIWTAYERFQFTWLNDPLAANTENAIPEIETKMEIPKLVIAIIKTAYIEIQVLLDYFYKDTVGVYENILFPHSLSFLDFHIRMSPQSETKTPRLAPSLFVPCLLDTQFNIRHRFV